MSTLVLSTTSPFAMDRLTPSWIRRSRSPRDKSPQDTKSRPATATSNGFLSPRPTDSTTASEDSRSSQPNAASSRRASIRGVVHRLRSSSSASSLNTQTQEVPISDIHDWFRGFQRYNALVTSGTTPQELKKACKPLTKNCGGNFIHSLPEATFDLALLWCPTSKPSETTTTATNPNEPSWSWTSSPTSVNFPLDPTTSPDLTRLPKDNTPLFRSEITQFHIGPATNPYTLRRDDHASLRLKYPPYFHAPRGSDPTQDSSTLRFTTTAIPADSFTAEQLHYRDPEIPCSQLLNAAHQHCGLILDFESSISEPCDQGPFEFVLLSRTRRTEPSASARRPRETVMHPPGVPIWDGERFLWDEEVVEVDEAAFVMGEWSMLNVLLVRWVGEYAVRVAVARIHEDEWAARNPVRKDIVLK